MQRRRFLAILMLIASAIAGCQSTTVIKTQPSGAKVYADGMLLGSSPVTYTDTKIVGSTTHLTIKRPGCEEKTALMSRSEKFEVGPCIGGVFVLVPFLWVMGYNPERTYELECAAK